MTNLAAYMASTPIKHKCGEYPIRKNIELSVNLAPKEMLKDRSYGVEYCGRCKLYIFRDGDGDYVESKDPRIVAAVVEELMKQNPMHRKVFKKD